MFILWHRRTGNRTLLLVLRSAHQQHGRRRHARLPHRNFAAAAAARFCNVAAVQFR
jgi:hypothetical protein